MSLGNIHLTPQLVQAVRDAVDVVGIASDHTKLTRRGKRMVGLCPLHKEKTPSFSVDPEQGLFYCFGCGVGGDAIKLHMMITGDDFPAAIEALAGRYGIPIPRGTRRSGEDADRGPDLRPALEAAEEFFRQCLARSPGARDYLARRQISDELVEAFRLGYAPDAWEELLRALSPQVPLAELEAAGLVGRSRQSGKPYDRFRHRLVFPIRNASGRLVGFGGRTLGDAKAKYVNTAETDAFHKGSLLYGLDRAKRFVRESGQVLLVEGYFDVLGAVASGCDGAVAGMGTALTAEQARLLARYADEVVVGFDGDSAGDTAFRRSLPLLLSQGLGVRRALFGAGEDPDSLRLSAGPEAVARAVEEAEDGVLLEIERLVPDGVERQPRHQAKAATAVAELLASLSDPIVRRGYGRLAAERLRVPEELLWRRVGSGGERGRPSVQAADPAPAPSAPAPAGEPKVVRSLEEQVLARLLTGGGPPSPSALPPPESFFDSTCRNIYLAYRDLYSGESASPPSGKAVLARLAADGGAVDRLAQILLDSSSTLDDADPAALLDRLQRRFWQQRLRDVVREIGEAQRRGDPALLERLLSEKNDLSRRLHRSS